MSMPLQSGPPADATVEAPAVEAPAVEAPAVEEPAALHPAWARTLDEAGIPDMLRPKLIEQIRRSEAEANSAVEKAKAESVDPSWREFIEMSKGVNASPEDLVRSWNATQEMVNDPFGHMDRFTAQVDELVKSGKMPARQAAAVKADEQQQVNEIIGLETPEQQQIAALQRRLDDQDTERAQQAELSQADEYANLFYGELDKATTGLDLDQSGKDNVRDLADTALFNDKTGRLTPAEAITNAIARLGIKAAAAPAGNPPMPIGGGGSSIPATVKAKFANNDAREAAMLDEARRVLAQNN
jgi:polyhydroxyalkanoate synthesis regulator phasin